MSSCASERIDTHLNSNYVDVISDRVVFLNKLNLSSQLLIIKIDMQTPPHRMDTHTLTHPRPAPVFKELLTQSVRERTVSHGLTGDGC